VRLDGSASTKRLLCTRIAHPSPALRYRQISVGVSQDARAQAYRAAVLAVTAEQETIDTMRFDPQPHLVGKLIDLRPMRPDDWQDLYAVAADPLIWEVHPARDRYKEDRFREYFREGLESGGALVAVERETGKIIGASRYFWYGPDQNELEIGWTFLARSHWGGVYNGEMKRLMLDYAFRFVHSVIFLVGIDNIRSQKAMRKVGAILTERRVRTTLHGTSTESVIFEVRKPIER
jgi:N-acetyltransferase